jgi:hypothetical protein
MSDSWTNQIVVTSVRNGRVSLAARKLSSCRPVEIVARASASTGRNMVVAVDRCLVALGFEWGYADIVDILRAMPTSAAGICAAALEYIDASEQVGADQPAKMPKRRRTSAAEPAAPRRRVRP